MPLRQSVCDPDGSSVSPRLLASFRALGKTTAGSKEADRKMDPKDKIAERLYPEAVQTEFVRPPGEGNVEGSQPACLTPD